jgi:hypothetical protein
MLEEQMRMKRRKNMQDVQGVGLEQHKSHGEKRFRREDTK